MIQIGDKVRFLNAVGGGIVTQLKSKELVLVADEDGFEVPVLIRECVVVTAAKEPVTPPPTKAVETAPLPTEASAEPELPLLETPEGEQINFFLAYLPVEKSSLSNHRFESYLVNDSNYYITYRILSERNGNYLLRAAGEIEPNITLFLEEIEKESLGEIEHIKVQLLAYKRAKPFAPKPVYDLDVRIDTVKFFRPNTFRLNDYFEDDALLFSLITDDKPLHKFVITPQTLAAAMQEKTASDRPRQAHIHKPKVSPVIEIDLHSHELLDTTAGMSNSEILNYQLETLRKTMAQYIAKKGQKIVFIHGKGDGVLRQAVTRELKSRYRNCTVQDASFAEYGFGATLVVIR